jgi:hypothetical protein
MHRHELPLNLAGAANFTQEAEELDPVFVVKLLKWQAAVRKQLKKATTIEVRGGKKRSEGDWDLAYMAFVATRKFPDIQPWWSVFGKNPEIWKECGFKNGRPAYSTVRDHFLELEQFAWAFQDAVAAIIQKANKHPEVQGRIGRDVNIDSTEDETHARLVHDCDDHAHCARQAELSKREFAASKKGKTLRRQQASPAKLPVRESSKIAGDKRRDLASEHPHQVDVKLSGLDPAQIVRTVDGQGREITRIRMNGCWYRTLDTAAGIRAYTDGKGKVKRFWHGYYNTKAIDEFTDAPVVVYVSSASKAEYHTYPEILHHVQETIGGNPRSIIGDKGYSIESVFKTNTEQGILTVAPFRAGNKKTRPEYATDQYDEHGIPLCKHCGVEGTFVSFTLTPKPRILYRCSINCPGSQDANGNPKRQSIYCETKWRLLLPTFRTTELYMALRSRIGTKERVHGYWRRRYHVAGDSVDNRVKRNGAGARQLRANAALLIEWLVITWRQGWLGGVKRNHAEPKIIRGTTAKNGLVSYRSSSARAKLLNAAAGGARAGAGGGAAPGAPPPGPPPGTAGP